MRVFAGREKGRRARWQAAPKLEEARAALGSAAALMLPAFSYGL